MAAYLIKTDIERWKKCAKIATFLKRFNISTYCMNRAIKQTEDTEELIKLKFEKIGIYKLQNDYSSAVRTL